MNRDYNNLQYILNKTPDELLVWWNSLDDEDKAYAMEIIIEYRKILDEPVVEDYSLARKYLKKFQLNTI
jgi:hypothetical protein